MSAILLNNLLGALVINDNDSWEAASGIEQKVSDLAEAIEYSGLNPDVRQEMLKHLFMINSLRDISTPKHGVAEGVASGEPTQQKRVHNTKQDLKDLIVITNKTTEQVTFINNVTKQSVSEVSYKLNPLAIAFSLRKLNFDISRLGKSDTLNEMHDKLSELKATFKYSE